MLTPRQRGARLPRFSVVGTRWAPRRMRQGSGRSPVRCRHPGGRPLHCHCYHGALAGGPHFRPPPHRRTRRGLSNSRLLPPRRSRRGPPRACRLPGASCT
eukprot:9127387-Alexandrium_andersonii.AAC.1